MEFTQKLDTVTPEQVIEVPMLSHDRIPQRSALRRPLKAEQLVEVPTIVVLRLAPAARSSRSLTFQFWVVEVVVEGEVLKVFPQNRILQHGLWNRTSTLTFFVDVVFREVFHFFTQDKVQGLHAEAFKVFSQDKVRCSAMHLEIWTLFCGGLVSDNLFCAWVLPCGARKLEPLGDDFSWGAVFGSTVDTCSWRNNWLDCESGIGYPRLYL